MARGRQKAKHMKVARRLKYYSPEPDLNALQRELSGAEDETEDAYLVDSDDSDDQDDEEAYWTDDWSGYDARDWANGWTDGDSSRDNSSI